MLGNDGTVQQQSDELASLINWFCFMQKSMTASLINQFISHSNDKEDENMWKKILISDPLTFYIVKKQEDAWK